MPEWVCTTREADVETERWNLNHFQSMFRIDSDENLPGTHKKTLVCRLLSATQPCEGALCCRPHIVLQLSPETNAPRTSTVAQVIVDHDYYL